MLIKHIITQEQLDRFDQVANRIHEYNSNTKAELLNFYNEFVSKQKVCRSCDDAITAAHNEIKAMWRTFSEGIKASIAAQNVKDYKDGIKEKDEEAERRTLLVDYEKFKQKNKTDGEEGAKA